MGANRELKREELLHSLLNSANDLVWCTTVGGDELLYVNPAAERIYGEVLTRGRGARLRKTGRGSNSH